MQSAAAYNTMFVLTRRPPLEKCSGGICAHFIYAGHSVPSRLLSRLVSPSCGSVRVTPRREMPRVLPGCVLYSCTVACRAPPLVSSLVNCDGFRPLALTVRPRRSLVLTAMWSFVLECGIETVFFAGGSCIQKYR